jgi:toxin-antitoxin system PIN domain toxin
MIAIDTNLLIYAHRRDSPWHDRAERAVRGVAEGRALWAIPWPCVHEFISVTTHPHLFNPPSLLSEALEQLDAWLASPTVVLLSETLGHWDHLRTTLVAGRIMGPRVHDARVATLCLLHGVSELWSADRDFGRFPELRVRNPLVG